jgi:hypothetical protein
VQRLRLPGAQKAGSLSRIASHEEANAAGARIRF